MAALKVDGMVLLKALWRVVTMENSMAVMLERKMAVLTVSNLVDAMVVNLAEYLVSNLVFHSVVSTVVPTALRQEALLVGQMVDWMGF
jgi:hypothetical protein